MQYHTQGVAMLNVVVFFFNILLSVFGAVPTGFSNTAHGHSQDKTCGANDI